MPQRDLVGDGDIHDALKDAQDAGSPDAVIERLVAAVYEPERRAEDFDPAYALAVVSELYLEFERPDEAVETLYRGLEAGVRGANDLKADLVACLAKAGRPDEAAEVFEELRQAGDADFWAYSAYGEALEQTGRLADALAVFTAGEQLARSSGWDPDIQSMSNAVERVRQAMA